MRQPNAIRPGRRKLRKSLFNEGSGEMRQEDWDRLVCKKKKRRRKTFEGFVGANKKDGKSERGFHMHAYVNNVLITEHPDYRHETEASCCDLSEWICNQTPINRPSISSAQSRSLPRPNQWLHFTLFYGCIFPSALLVLFFSHFSFAMICLDLALWDLSHGQKKWQSYSCTADFFVDSLQV